MQRMSARELAERAASRACNITPETDYARKQASGVDYLTHYIAALGEWAAKYYNDDVSALRRIGAALLGVLAEGPIALPAPAQDSDIIAEDAPF